MEDPAAITEDISGAASDLVSDDPGELELITDENDGFEDLIDTEQPPDEIVDPDAVVDPALATDAVEKTEEEQALDAELKGVQPGGLVGHLRKVTSSLFKERSALNTRVSELETELQTAQGVMFRPTVPAEDFAQSGKAKEFWDDIATNHPAYYDHLVNDAMRAHLNPERLAANPGSVPQGVIDVFAQSWLPDFIEKTFGLDMPSFSALIERHNSGQLSESGNATNRGDVSAAALTSEQVAKKFNLDPATDADIIEEIISKDRALTAERARVNSIEAQVRKLSEAQNGTSKQQMEREAEQRVAHFDGLLATDKKNLLDTALKALPRGADGQILKEFAHLPDQISDLVDVALNRDEQYKASRDATKKWFRQPGSAETAKALASGDLKKLYGAHQTLVTRIAKDALKPYEALINARGRIEQNQRSRTVVPGGVNPGNNLRSPARSPAEGTSWSLAEEARRRRQSL